MKSMKELIITYRENKDLLSVKEQIQVIENQIKILNTNNYTAFTKVREYNKLLISLYTKLLEEEGQKQMTNKGRENGVVLNNDILVSVCPNCQGSGLDNNKKYCTKCHQKGYIFKKVKIVNEIDYKKILLNMYYNKCKKRNALSNPFIENYSIEQLERIVYI